MVFFTTDPENRDRFRRLLPANAYADLALPTAVAEAIAETQAVTNR